MGSGELIQYPELGMMPQQFRYELQGQEFLLICDRNKVNETAVNVQCKAHETWNEDSKQSIVVTGKATKDSYEISFRIHGDGAPQEIWRDSLITWTYHHHGPFGQEMAARVKGEDGEFSEEWFFCDKDRFLDLFIRAISCNVINKADDDQDMVDMAGKLSSLLAINRKWIQYSLNEHGDIYGSLVCQPYIE